MLRIAISVLHDGDDPAAGGIDEGGCRDDSSVMMVRYSTVLCLPIQIERYKQIVSSLTYDLFSQCNMNIMR